MTTSYHRLYRQVSAGPYKLTVASKDVRMRIDGIHHRRCRRAAVADSSSPTLLAMIPPAGATPPTPAQTRELIEKVAGFYEGIRIGNAEMRGISVDTPQGRSSCRRCGSIWKTARSANLRSKASIRSTPKGPVKVGRFALKSLDIANLMRMAAQFANPAQPPSPDQMLGLLPLLEGVEIKGVAAPFKNTDKPVNDRQRRPGLGPVRRPDPEQGASDR